MFCAILGTAHGSHLGKSNCKKSKLFIKETFWHKVGSIITNGSPRYCLFCVYAILVTVPGGHLDRYILFNFETTQCKNHFDTNLVKIHYAVTEVLSFSCFALFLITPNSGHLVTANCKKSKRLHTINILAQS